MSNVMKARTFSISENTFNDIIEICNVFDLTKSTLYRISIYNGIQRIGNGYQPTRDHRKKQKVKVKMNLSQDTWEVLDYIINKVRYTWKEFIPIGELVNIFIDIEIKEFKQYQKLSDEYNRDHSCIPVYLKLNVPYKLHSHINAIEDMTGSDSTQLWKYFAYRGLMDEYLFKDTDSIYTDIDLLYEIKELGLSRQKTMTLLRYLIKSGRITWND